MSDLRKRKESRITTEEARRRNLKNGLAALWVIDRLTQVDTEKELTTESTKKDFFRRDGQDNNLLNSFHSNPGIPDPCLIAL